MVTKKVGKGQMYSPQTTKSFVFQPMSEFAKNGFRINIQQILLNSTYLLVAGTYSICRGMELELEFCVYIYI